MAYSELIKNFERIRDYMREFYVYGFKSRDEFTKKSARSYDDERRRVESWLGDYMRFRQTADGKKVFLSIDSRISHHNPFYKAWKAKSFTDGDITLHFLIFDVLSGPDIALPLSGIMDEIDRRLSCFDEPKTFDASTVRKKLKEYAEQGLICTDRSAKTLLYRRAATAQPACTDALDFFSEVAPCGVIGSFLLDKADSHEEHFVFKHHYITGALDSEILYRLFEAMHRKQSVQIETVNRRRERTAAQKVVPLRIFISVQNGRQYLMAYAPRNKRIGSIIFCRSRRREIAKATIHTGRSLTKCRSIFGASVPKGDARGWSRWSLPCGMMTVKRISTAVWNGKSAADRSSVSTLTPAAFPPTSMTRASWCRGSVPLSAALSAFIFPIRSWRRSSKGTSTRWLACTG